MPVLPRQARVYREVRFTEHTIPAGLLRAHNTKKGVWARIVVEEGHLRYRIRDGLGGEFLLEPGHLIGIVPPEVIHEVALDGPVVFVVQFCRIDTPPEDED
ncbi:MAG: DUF1971 domain-containing protein [Proteobacteria bacterium]|nr:DUF1971 domain-containing protein [Pseudomonadota bacterium]